MLFERFFGLFSSDWHIATGPMPLIFLVTKLSFKQYGQMDKLSFHYLAVYNKDNLHNITNMYQSG